MILFELKREPEGGAGDAKKFYCPLKILCSPGSEATDYFLSILKIRAYDINITINVKGVTAWFRISHSHKIRFNTKYSLYKSLIVPVLLYGCDTWTLLTEAERRIRAFESKCSRKLLQISYKEHRTKDLSTKQDSHTRRTP